MKKYLLLIIIFCISVFHVLYAQEDDDGQGVLPCLEHGVTVNSYKANPANGCSTLNMHRYQMYQGGTWSFRNSSTADSLAGYYPMAGFTTTSYTQGYIKDIPGPNTNDFLMNYRLLYPAGYNDTYEPGFPLLVMFHGAGERGNCWGGNNCHFDPPQLNTASKRLKWNPNDPVPPAGPAWPELLNNDHNLLHGGSPNLNAVNLAGNKLPNNPTLDPRAWPGLVLFPQNLNGWDGTAAVIAIKIIYKLIVEENIDPNRIYIYGLSNGAASIVTALKRDPSLFAAAVIMSPTGANVKFRQDTALSQSPLWVFQGGQDTAPSPSQTETLIRWFEEGGGVARYTFYPNAKHNTWSKAFNEPDFYSWILEQNKANLHVFYGDSSICATNGKGAKLGMGYGFAEYEWERDGEIISGVDGPITFANEPGVYRGRFRRSAGEEWNIWSKPVTIQESIPQIPVLTALGSTHLPDINGKTDVTIQAPISSTDYFHWVRNSSGLSDTANYITVSTAGVYGLTTESFGGCPSEPSDNIYVTVNAPVSLNAPSGIQTQTVSSGAIQLFWTDNSPNESGFEIYRATNPSGPYTFVGVTQSDAVGYKDTGLQSSKTYYYNLRAVNNTAVSPYSGNVTGGTAGDDTRPTPPSNLVATDHDINTISLSWGASTDNTGIKQYHIYYGTNSVVTGNINTTYKLEGLTPNTSYIITVKAEDYDGNLSYASNQISRSTVVSGLSYEHTTGVWNSLDEIDWAGVPEFTGHVDKVTIADKVQNDYINFKFQGYVYITQAGNYEFRAYSDDGSRVYLNGFDPSDQQAFIVHDNDGLHGNNGGPEPTTVNLAVGYYPITVTFFENSGGESLALRWTTPSNDTYTEVPASAFKSGNEIITTPPIAPENLSASASGMSSIDLSWNYTGDNIEDLNVVVLGSSTAEGTGASAGNSWVELLDTWLGDNFTNHTLTNLALGGFTTEDVRATGSTPAPDATRNITAALAEDPDVIIINLPSNDTAEEIPVETSLDYLREVVAQAEAAGVKVYVTTTQPRNFGGDQIKRDLLQVRADSIRNAFGENVIDIYDYLTDFSDNKKIKSEFNFDGTHVNDDGHAYIFSEVQAKLSELLTNFEVYRSLTSDGTYNIVGQTLGGELTFYDEDLLPNTDYYYKLKSINENGSSGFSNVANTTTGTDTEVPTAPTGLTIVSSSNNNVGFSWTASTDNVGVTGYEIFANNILIGTSDVVTYTDIFAPDEAYDVKVRAYDASDNKSGYSNIVNFSVSGSTITFYSQANGDIDDLATWGTNESGTGDHPVSFTYNGQSFVIANRTTATIDSDLDIGGALSKIIVGEDVTLTLNAELTGNIAAEDNAVINVNHDYDLSLVDLSPLSTINYNTYSNVALADYGNLNLNGSGNKIFAEGATTVAGDLTVATGVALKGVPGNSSVLSITGDLTLNGTSGTVTPDTQLDLIFDNSGTSTLTVNDDINFFRIDAPQGNIILNNQAAEPITVNLGSDNGGGLSLSNNSAFTLGDNDLAIIGNGVVNSTNTTGKLGFSGGDLTMASATGTASHLYFDATDNTVNTFTIDQAGANVIVHNALNLTDGIKIDNGIVNSNGNITLKSTAEATANIKEIENSGFIAGDVIVERYMAPKGRIYKYLSSPVADARVADWQDYIPVTGTFGGASTGSGLGNNASMFYYDEPNGGYIAYPPAAGNNNAELLRGRGYAIFIRKANEPTTLITEGEAHQGDIPFTLTGGTGGGADDGWNLLGNPYASDIVWASSGWTSSGVGNVISVRSNDANGESQYFTWDRQSGTGSLDNGKIPAGQAFWVQTTNGSPTLTVTESAKTTDVSTDNTEFYRESEEGKVNYAFSLHLSDNTYEDYALIKFRPSGQNIYEKLYDGAKKFNTFFNLSTRSSDGEMLSVNDLSDEFCSQLMPVTLSEGRDEDGQIKTFPSGTYHLHFGSIQSFDIATIQLIDSLKNQTIDVTASTDYQFNVASDDPTTYKERFYLNITKTDLDLNKLVEAPVAMCSATEIAAIDILNSQPGVQYTATINNGTTISESVVGNSMDISLNIEGNKLAQGDNLVKIKATHSGCNSNYLAQDIKIVLTNTPVTTVERNLYSSCFGSKIDINATGAGPDGSYKWYDEDRSLIEGETGNTLTTRELGYQDIYYVRAVNKYGCENPKEYASIEIESDSLAKPTVEFDNGLLNTNMTDNVQWYYNGEIIDGANASTYLPENSGIYAVESSNGVCRKASEDFEYVITDIFKPVGDEQFSLIVYPNPSKDYNFNVKGNASVQSKVFMQLLDVTGRIKLDRAFSSESYQKGISIELEEKLAAGVYIIQISQGGKVLQKKLIIE